MYTRDLSKMPASFVKDKKPVFGTFLGHPKRLDIRGVYKPYSTLSLPPFITNLRIKSRITTYFILQEYVGYINFIDAKMFGWAEVIFWNVQTKQKFVFHNIMGPKKRLIPHDLEKASTSSYRKSRYIRVSWDRTRGNLSIIFNLKGNKLKPSVNGALLADFNSPDFAELTYVLPSPTMRRCSASYISCMHLKGTLNFFPKHQNSVQDSVHIPETQGLCVFEMNRIYTSFRNRGEYVIGFGDLNGKLLSFRLEEKISEEVSPERLNDNQLMYDGKTTLLPPVKITHPYGLNKKWIIQDTEGMIDLSFTPISDNRNKISVFILRTVYHIIYGTFEGTLMTKEGEKLSFKSINGIADKYLVRL